MAYARRSVREPTGGSRTSLIGPPKQLLACQTTHIYEHADPALKEQAIARTVPPGAKPGRYRPPDTLLAFLEGL
jgi:hypothetical protein